MAILAERVVWRKRRQQGRKRTERLGVLTAEQSANVLAGLRQLRAQHGTWQRVADAIPVSVKTIERVLAGRRKVTAGWAMRVAELLGERIDDVLGGVRAEARGCPACGGARLPGVRAKRFLS